MQFSLAHIHDRFCQLTLCLQLIEPQLGHGQVLLTLSQEPSGMLIKLLATIKICSSTNTGGTAYGSCASGFGVCCVCE